MIRRLRWKFILVNMVLVFLVLLIVFAALGLSTKQRAEKEIQDALIKTIGYEGQDRTPGPKSGLWTSEPFSLVPVFTVSLDETGTVTSSSLERVEVEESVVLAATQAVMAQDAQEGMLAEWGLRYLRQETKDGTKIAFADTSAENAAMAQWLVNSLLIGIGGLAGFFLISLFLSRWALKPVTVAWEQQKQFVADASHELKTPLTVILANVGILLRHPEETVEKQKKWVEYTKDEAERMKKLVDGLLFLAKYDAARIPVPPIPLNVSDVVWNSVLPFESVAFEQHIALNSQIAPDLWLLGDEGQLKQLTAILLDNACKYAGEGGAVTIALERIQDKAFLSVHNTGIPISPEQLPRIFERFYRADSSRARAQGGYGLGLAIAQTIVEGHHGKITAESTKEAGTTFAVTLPMRDK